MVAAAASNPPLAATSTPLVNHSAPGHRCAECALTGALQRLEADFALVRQERTRLADEVIALSGQLAAVREERDIAVRRAARAVAERDAALGLAQEAIEPFCACGNVISRCDQSRRGCTKTEAA